MSLKDSELFEKSELQRDLPIPLYYQIYKLIKDDIESGELLPGDKILTEEKLQKI